jgi:flagellar protein FliS
MDQAMDQTANSYLTTRVMSASPQELRLLLLEGAVKFARQACEGLRTKNFELSYNGFTQARAVALELITGISEDADPDVAEKVRAVFLFIYRELMDASFEKNIARTEKVVELLEYERDTWVLAMERIASEKRGGGAPGRDAGGARPPERAAGPRRPGTGAEPPRQGSLSIQA